jgi:hypothetical protein
VSGLIMFDAVDVSAIPGGATVVAGYTDGLWQTVPLLRIRFPHARILTIAVFASGDAECLDVEAGDATPGQAPAWVRRQQARGLYRPVLYTSVSNVPALLSALDAAGIRRDEVRLWSAHYTGVAHRCGPSTCAYPGLTTDADGTQFTDHARGQSLDESLLLPTFFDGPPKPAPAHHGVTPRGDEMFYIPVGAGEVVALPVPKFILGLDFVGALAAVKPSVMRLTTNAPAQLEYMLGASGKWLPVSIDYARSPGEIALNGAQAIKLRRQDAGINLVTGDFA